MEEEPRAGFEREAVVPVSRDECPEGLLLLTAGLGKNLENGVGATGGAPHNAEARPGGIAGRGYMGNLG
ncbi:MAG: hypothetical protein Q8Q12_06400 [bacterium]|nr:hypothetical protein [bacterium]